jgi:predicted metal-dependent HD superfamily phosphohydrolase
LGIDDVTTCFINEIILATKTHVPNENPDVNFFTDADLSVLGQSFEVYIKYYENIRKEYAWYPNIIYNRGRKKVLEHFLAMERIYKTDYFFDKFEKQARSNMAEELRCL